MRLTPRVEYRRYFTARYDALAALLPANSRLALIGTVFVLAVLNYGFRAILTHSELDVMLLAKRFVDPHFLPGDFALSEPGTPRAAFLVLMYPLVKFLPLVKATLAGRILAYLFMSVAVGLLAWRMGVGVGSTCAAAGVYLWLGQSYLPVGDALFKRLEALVPAYCLLLYGLNALVTRRLRLAGLLAGAALTFHVLVGMWGAFALGLTAVTMGLGRPREWLSALGLWCLSGSLGLYHGLSFLREPAPTTPFDLTYVYVFFRNPLHFFPACWNRAPGQFEVAAVLLLFVLAAGLTRSDAQSAASTAVARFTLFSLVPFAAGLLIRPLPWAPAFMEATYPFRVGSSLLLPLGLLIAVPAILRFVCRPEKLRAAVTGGAVILVFWHAAGGFVTGVRELRTFPEGGRQHGGFRTTRERYRVCHWIRDHTEPNALLLAPQDLEVVSLLSGHPVVLRWKSIPFTKANMAEWYRRMIDFNGGREPTQLGFAGRRQVRSTFQRLTADQYRRLGRKYGAKCLLLRRRTVPGLRKLYENRGYSVFSLGNASSHAGS